MHQPVGQFTVVGHDEHALDVFVETAEGENPRFDPLNAVHDGFAAEGVSGRGDDVRRLVQHDIDFRVLFDGLLIHRDAV